MFGNSCRCQNCLAFDSSVLYKNNKGKQYSFCSDSCAREFMLRKNVFLSKYGMFNRILDTVEKKEKSITNILNSINNLLK